MSAKILYHKYPLIRILPIVGCLIFLLLYFLATLYYPGGTYLDLHSKGFSWVQNYWCNLLNLHAINGNLNPARPIALTALAVLSCTLMVFWWIFPSIAGFEKWQRSIIQVSGFISMLIASFIFTDLHDMVINLAGLFGMIALVGTLLGLKKLGWIRLFYMGGIVIMLIIINNIFYYRKDLIYYLPVIQKITFLYFLMWIAFINVQWLRCKN